MKFMNRSCFAFVVIGFCLAAVGCASSRPELSAKAPISEQVASNGNMERVADSGWTRVLPGDGL